MNYNQVTVPLALMNAIMTAMQTQPQLQSIGGVPNTINGLTVPQLQQPGLGFPNLVLQPPHLQAAPAPSTGTQPQAGGQPWPGVLHPLHTVNALQPSGSAAKQPTIDEIVAGVVEAMKAAPQEAAPDKSMFGPDDERLLVNTLRKAKAEGLTPLQGFSKLDQVNNHAISAWKDYFIRHVDRLGPKVYPQAYSNPVPASSKSVASSSRSKRTSGGRGASSLLSRPPITGDDTSGSEQSTPNEDAAAGGSAAGRSKRGAPVVEYHEETRIPYLSPGVKPEAPRRDPPDDNPRFTKEDKIFFIHYLKYRLRKGPVPSKEQLCKELAKQTPHHHADSWKRHWDNACRLPNEIYIQARKRVHSSREVLHPPAPRSQESGSHDSESSEEEEDSRDEEEEVEDGTRSELNVDLAYKLPASRVPSSVETGKAKKQRSSRKYRITEEEIRAMARYIVDKRKCDGWEALPAHLRWAEFVKRPLNRKRTLKAWINITYARATDINAYVEEYESEEAQKSDTGEKPSVPPAVYEATDSRLRLLKDRKMRRTASSSKRALEDEEVKSGGSVAQKRAKLAEIETIVISD